MIDFSKTQHLIDSMVNNNIVPGANYAFIKGEQVFTSTVGFASIYPKQTQLSPSADYDLASLTKVLATENVLLKLYDQAIINFTEPVNQFIPEIKDDRLRLFHLLTHTSGIKGWIPNRDSLNHDELIASLLKLPITDEFNKKMHYSDINFILLGLVIKQLFNGEPVQKVATNEIFKPMGLTHTTFHPNPVDCVPTSIVNGKVLQGIPHDPKARQLGEDCGSAGLFSNMDDLIKISRGYLGLDRDILPYSQETVSKLFDIKTPRKVKPRSWGWDLRFDPVFKYPIILHTGFTGTLMILDRIKQSGLILLTNRIHPAGHNLIFLTMRKRIIESFVQENAKQ